MTAGMFERLKRRFLSAGRAPVAPGEASPTVLTADRVAIDLHATLTADYPAEYPVAETVTSRVISAVAGVDLGTLARRSPSLKGYDWPSYLHCSLCRLVRAQRALSLHVPAGGRVLDFGSYFGNFSLVARAMGFQVDAVDSYAEYGSAMATLAALQRAEGILVHDFNETGHDLGIFGPHVFDAVICAGVIEHIPHTPRLLLETVTRALKPGGVLILDTPNLAYLYKRLALLDGRSIFAPIVEQYYTELPFEGHHREYTVDELTWMLNAAGHQLLSVETFNYSQFGQSELTGEHAAYFREMEGDPALREVILTVSRSPLNA